MVGSPERLAGGKTDGEGGDGFLLALAASLILHLAIIYGVVVEPPRKEGGKPVILQARIAPQPPAKTALTAPARERKETARALVRPPAEPEPSANESQPETARPAESSSGLPAVEIPLPEDPTYYPARQLDAHASPLHPIRPEYPEAAAAANIGGEAVVLVLIDEFGTVREATVVEANPPGYFEQSSLEAFRNARFVPAQRNGRNVKSRFLVRVRFEVGSDGALQVK
ncbi:MAG: TonB family protein [Pseudomonadota bacterium]